MASLPAVSGERAVRAFQKEGWIKDRQQGSHVILVKQGNPASLSIPQHRELAPGTLRSLIPSSGMPVAELAELHQTSQPALNDDTSPNAPPDVCGLGGALN